MDLILKRAAVIEKTAHAAFDAATYRHKIRQLYTNFMDKKNPGLRESVVSGDMPAESVATMSSAVRRFISPPLSAFLSFFRTWLRQNRKQSEHVLRPRTCLPLWVQAIPRQRQMPSSVDDANSASVVIARRRRGVPMSL
jgi:hypothetical protein